MGLANQSVTETLRGTLASKLADSLAGPIPAGTPRRVYGTIALPRKATAVIGMRRAKGFKSALIAVLPLRLDVLHISFMARWHEQAQAIFRPG